MHRPWWPRSGRPHRLRALRECPEWALAEPEAQFRPHMPNMNGGDLEAPQLKKRTSGFNFSSRSSGETRPGSNKRLSVRGARPPPPFAPSFAPLCQHPSLLPPPSSSPLPLRLPPSLPARDLPLRSVSPRVFSPSHCHAEAAASFRALRVLRLPVSLLWAPARHAKMPRARSWPRHSRFVSSHPHPQHV